MGFEHRFEMPADHQVQVDFAQFKVVFTEEPQRVQVVWLFSMVLGWSLGSADIASVERARGA